MQRRPSARLLILDPLGRVLLFRFTFRTGALAGQAYWATPGGALEEGESFEQAAIRELFEETGHVATSVGEPVAEREFVLQMPDGNPVLAHERFFVVPVPEPTFSAEHWTPWERQVMTEHRWWSLEEIRSTEEVVYPETLSVLLATL